MTHFLAALAQQAAPSGAAGSQSFLTNMIPMVLIFGVFWLLVIRPQAKKAKLQQQMLSELKAGDDIVTNGGILGRITGIRDDEITVQIQEGVRIRILRSAITGRYTPGGAKVAPKADAKAS